MDTRNRSYTKKGPGRKHRGIGLIEAPKTAHAPTPSRKLPANVGRGLNVDLLPVRRVWREGEPLHVVKPVRTFIRSLKEST